MRRIVEISVVEHSKQRYDTCGDWKFEDGVLKIYISDLKDERYNFLVAIHELIEAVLCDNDGITTEQVDTYDMNHQDDKLGSDCFSDHPNSPIFLRHGDALSIEWLLARLMNVDWKDYSKRIGDL